MDEEILKIKLSLEADHQLQLSKIIQKEHLKHNQETALAVLKAKELFDEEKQMMINAHMLELLDCQKSSAFLETEIEVLEDKIFNLEVNFA